MLTATILLAAPRAALADEIREDQWHLRELGVTQAHTITTGEGVTVGVVDTGVYPHVELRKNLLDGNNVLEQGAGDGRSDESGHGTSMAGVIAAHGRNGDGVLGIAPSARILPIKESDRTETGGSDIVAAGIEWAATNGASVINVSSANAPSIALQNAIEVAAAKDSVVVAGSGNRPTILQLGYPAAIDGVLAVGATDRKGVHAAFSIGGKPLQICAPGVDILSTRSDGRYSVSSGTSASTAIVSGAAALVRAKFPDLTAPEVIHRLTATATDIGRPGRDDECGYGLLNIVQALTAEVPPLDPPPSATPTPAAATPQQTPEDSNLPAIAGGTAAVLVALITFLLLRQRRRRRNTS